MASTLSDPDSTAWIRGRHADVSKMHKGRVFPVLTREDAPSFTRRGSGRRSAVGRNGEFAALFVDQDGEDVIGQIGPVRVARAPRVENRHGAELVGPRV